MYNGNLPGLPAKVAREGWQVWANFRDAVIL
jgi:hypothetical protein